jgi:hypothetical protein
LEFSNGFSLDQVFLGIFSIFPEKWGKWQKAKENHADQKSQVFLTISETFQNFLDYLKNIFNSLGIFQRFFDWIFFYQVCHENFQ